MIRYNDFTVVLPVLNERGTVGVLIDYIKRNYSGAEVIVADDGSTDGSKEIVSAIAKRDRRVMLLDRESAHRARGLTGSVIDGIISAKTKYIIVMDADMQHPPEIIGKMTEKLDLGYDVVVASRSEVKEWALYRKVISKTLISVGYALLTLSGKQTCGDIFSGYFGIKRSTFMKVFLKNKKRFVNQGYKILFDFLKCTRRGSIKITDVPYAFGTRKEGRSKAGIKQGIALIKSFFT